MPQITKLSQYAPFMVSNPRAIMSKFVLGVLDLVSKECKTTMLIKEMGILRLTTYAEKIKDENLRKKTRESKSAGVDSRNLPH